MGCSLGIVKPIGKVLYPNKDGYFVNTTDLDIPLQKDWQQPVRLCVQEIQKQFPNMIHSIYVRGSVAQRTAIAGVSDIDLTVVTKKDVGMSYWVNRAFVQKIREQYSQVDDIEFALITYNKLMYSKLPIGVRVVLKLHGRCMAGESIISKLPKVKADATSFIHIPVFSNVQKGIAYTLNAENVFLPAYIPWVAKRYIRTGFELCIAREKVFTRDLYPCYEIFSKYYPGKENEMYKVLEQAIRPTWSQSQLLGCVNTLGDWLELEIKKQYPKYI